MNSNVILCFFVQVFNCPANLASHRRWHKPPTSGDTLLNTTNVTTKNNNKRKRSPLCSNVISDKNRAKKNVKSTAITTYNSIINNSANNNNNNNSSNNAYSLLSMLRNNNNCNQNGVALNLSSHSKINNNNVASSQALQHNMRVKNEALQSPVSLTPPVSSAVRSDNCKSAPLLVDVSHLVCTEGQGHQRRSAISCKGEERRTASGEEEEKRSETNGENGSHSDGKPDEFNRTANVWKSEKLNEKLSNQVVVSKFNKNVCLQTDRGPRDVTPPLTSTSCKGDQISVISTAAIDRTALTSRNINAAPHSMTQLLLKTGPGGCDVINGGACCGCPYCGETFCTEAERLRHVLTNHAPRLGHVTFGRAPVGGSLSHMVV